MTLLVDLSKLKECYNEELDEYYLEHSPQAFAAVINFYRSGKLHMPKVIRLTKYL